MAADSSGTVNGEAAIAHAVEPANGVTQELELKLQTDPQCLRSLAEAPVVEAVARNRGTVRKLEAAYYDTPDKALEKAGYVLRVRRDGRRHVMTLKTAKTLAPDTLARGEWEVEVDDLRPDIARLSGDVPEKFLAAAGKADLVPQYTTSVRRRTRLLDLPHATIELAADEGVVAAGGRSEPISEIELELKQGDVTTLYELAVALSDFGRLDPSPRSKAARGIDLARGTAPAFCKASRPAFDAGITLDEAIAAMLRAALQHLLDNKAAAVDGSHPEGVHQARVALRRLRSILKIISSSAPSPAIERFRERAKRLADSMNDARNWDVFLTETLPPIEQGCPDVTGFADLRAAAELKRAKGYETVREAFSNAQSARFQLELALWIEQRGWRASVDADGLAELVAPARLFAEEVLARLHRKVLKRGRHFARLDAEERHKVRLAMKKLRYAADFFVPLLGGGKKVARYTNLLRRFQDLLGRYNDMATTAGLLAALEAKAPMSPAFAQSCGAVLGWQRRDLVGTEADLIAAWRNFKKAGRIWKGR